VPSSRGLTNFPVFGDLIVVAWSSMLIRAYESHTCRSVSGPKSQSYQKIHRPAILILQRASRSVKTRRFGRKGDRISAAYLKQRRYSPHTGLGTATGLADWMGRGTTTSAVEVLAPKVRVLHIR
jgi:hypothetical protein